MTVTPRTGSRIEELLARSGRFFIPGEISADLRTVTRRGGRDGDVFYRDRWSHDKVVRSTHALGTEVPGLGAIGPHDHHDQRR